MSERWPKAQAVGRGGGAGNRTRPKERPSGVSARFASSAAPLTATEPPESGPVAVTVSNAIVERGRRILAELDATAGLPREGVAPFWIALADDAEVTS